MLTHIHIKNVAVIENLNVDFKSGMSALTGETGAGKSIIIDSVNLILGARTNKSLIRYGEKKAEVQAMFEVSDTVADRVRAIGIDAEDNQVIVSREISEDGRSVSRINSVVVSTATLRSIGASLINIHGQHDSQALLTPSRHISFIDSFAKNTAERDAYRAEYSEYKSIERQIEELSMDEAQRAQRIDMLTYQIDEIEEAKPIAGEDETLIEQRDIIANAEKISVSVSEAVENLYDGGRVQSAYDGISTAVAALERVKEYAPALERLYSTLNEAMYNIEDCAHELRDYGENVDYNEGALNDIEERLELLSSLKRKYGGSISAVTAYCEKAKEELALISDSDNRLSELVSMKDAVQKRMKAAAVRLTETRQKAAEQIQRLIKKALRELDMPNAEFSASVESADGFTDNGADRVEFMISTNVGEPPKPLAKIASGGELSRIMLAIKSILADADEVDTMIFDEIDTGVSGSAAKKIAVKLSETAAKKQVLCITHSAVIAAAAENHYFIQKKVSGQKTFTSVNELDTSGREKELARIIDGADITQTALSHAREMLEQMKRVS